MLIYACNLDNNPIDDISKRITALGHFVKRPLAKLPGSIPFRVCKRVNGELAHSLYTKRVDELIAFKG